MSLYKDCTYLIIFVLINLLLINFLAFRFRLLGFYGRFYLKKPWYLGEQPTNHNSEADRTVVAESVFSARKEDKEARTLSFLYFIFSECQPRNNINDLLTFACCQSSQNRHSTSLPLSHMEITFYQFIIDASPYRYVPNAISQPVLDVSGWCRAVIILYHIFLRLGN